MKTNIEKNFKFSKNRNKTFSNLSFLTIFFDQNVGMVILKSKFQNWSLVIKNNRENYDLPVDA